MKKSGRRQIKKEVVDAVGQGSAASPDATPELTCQRLDFNTMPGVALIIPDPCSPGEMIRIVAEVAKQIGQYAIEQTVKAALGVK